MSKNIQIIKGGVLQLLLKMSYYVFAFLTLVLLLNLVYISVIAVAGIWLCEKNLIWVVNIIHSSFQFTLCCRVCICPLTLDRMSLVSRWYLWWPTTAIRKNDINLLILDWTLIILKWKWSETKKLKTYFLFHWTGNRLIFFYFQLKTKHFYYEMKIKVKIEIKADWSKINMFTAGNCHSKQKKRKINMFMAGNCHSKQKMQN